MPARSTRARTTRARRRPPPLAPRARPNRFPSTKRLRTTNPRPPRNPSARLPRKPSRARARAPRVQRAKTRQTPRALRTWAICSGACWRFRSRSTIRRSSAPPKASRTADGSTWSYPDEQFVTLSQRRGGLKMSEGEALALAIQVCQAVSFLNRRGLRLNDICPQSVAYGAGGRVKLTGAGLRQQRQRAAERADFQRRLHRARDLSRQAGRQAGRRVFDRRAALHVA